MFDLLFYFEIVVSNFTGRIIIGRMITNYSAIKELTYYYAKKNGFRLISRGKPFIYSKSFRD